MANYVTPTSPNGNHSRRIRPEHVALTVERLEHLTIEINSAATAEIMQHLHDLAALHKAITDLSNLQRDIGDRVVAHAGNGAEATS
jgi:hypothetical protein